MWSPYVVSLLSLARPDFIYQPDRRQTPQPRLLRCQGRRSFPLG